MDFDTQIENDRNETETIGEAQIINEVPETQSCTMQLLSRPKERAVAVLCAVADLKSIHESISKSEQEEDSFDVFGKSVAM